MRSKRFRAWLLEAVTAGSANLGCAAPSALTQPTREEPMPANAASARRQRLEPNPRARASSTPPSPAAASSPASYPVPNELTGDCPNGSRNVLRQLNPAIPFDYAELRQRQGNDGFQTLLAYGKPCLTAADVDACQRGLREAGATGFGACRPGYCDFHLVMTDTRGVTRLLSTSELARFLGLIDTSSEALLMAFANEHWVLDCDAKLPQKVGQNWTLVSNERIEECPVVTADVALVIGGDGSVRVLGVTNKKRTGMCVGRRPPGLRYATDAGSSSSAAALYLASCAYLETASIRAFEYLSSELNRLGAPAHLVRRCLRAASDERRHARVMTELAVGFGAKVPKLAISRFRPHTAESLAIDNAVEGCVRETFGAAVGLYQARHATHPRIRAAFGPIATDEARHAELAWKIAAWVEPRLDARARQRIGKTRRYAIDQLRAELRAEPKSQLRHTLGLPNATAALRMLAVLEARLWTLGAEGAVSGWQT